MLSLKTIGERSNSATVTLRGHEVEVRGLTFADRNAIESIWPRPQAPLVDDPTKGDLAPKVPDTSDPGYERAFARWWGQTCVVHALVAVGWQLTEAPGGVPEAWDATADPERNRAWAEAAIAELNTAGVTTDEIDRVYEASKRAERGEPGDARKNS